jgi:hypothetical protein
MERGLVRDVLDQEYEDALDRVSSCREEEIHP